MKNILIEDIYKGHLYVCNKQWTELDSLINSRKQSDDTIYQAITLYLITLNKISNLSYEWQDNLVEKLTNDLLQDALVPQKAFDFDEKVSHHLSVLGVIYSSLRKVNLYLKRDDVSTLLIKIKAYAFENLISGGCLMSDIDKKDIRFDLLLACVPFGLFEPEDLVLVEAVKILYRQATDIKKEISDQEKLLLIWYYIEQGSYDKARLLLTGIKEKSVLFKLINKKLELLGQLQEVFILHEPFGNDNRYEPCINERFPKHPIEGEDIIINAISVPLCKDLPVVLSFNDDVYNGHIVDGVWQFIVPAQKCDVVSKYFLCFDHKPEIKTEIFEVMIGKLECISRIDTVQVKGNELICSDGKMDFILKVYDRKIDWQTTFKSIDVKKAMTPNAESYDINMAGFDIKIVYSPFSFVISKAGEEIISSIKENSIQYKVTDGNIVESRLLLNIKDESFYGFGERYNSLRQDGNTLDQFVYNQYKDQGLRTYMPMPLYYTTKGYGFLLSQDEYSYIDIGSTEKNVLIIGSEVESMKGHFVFGTVKEQVGMLNSLTGPAELVPDWALGPWMSSNNWDSEAEVRKQVELTKKHNIPSTVLVIEAWSDEATFYIFNDAKYDEKRDGSAHRYEDFEFSKWGRWPDPKGLVSYLHENELKCILWQIPIIKQITSLHHLQKSYDEEYFINNGYCVKHSDGRPYRLPEGWFKDSLLMDYSNADAKKWWFKKRQYLLDDINVDGFKTDGGEFVFGRNLLFADGRTGRQMRNAYPNDYIEAYYEFSKQNKGITFSRAGYTGAQKFPAHWAGDERSTFDAFKRSILAGLSSGLSGVIFWGWDLGGFSGEIPSAELYIRSTQMATFCPIMQYHAESKAEHNQDRTPWNIAERTNHPEVIDIYRYYANLRMSMMPYILQEAKKCVVTGEPLMRALILDYENDKNVHDIWDTYMFGEKMLVAPIIRESSNARDVYLPEGRWFHLFKEIWYDGGHVIEINAKIDEIPVFIKGNCIVPMNINNSGVLGDNMSSTLDKYNCLMFLIIGDSIEAYEFNDKLGNNIVMSYKYDTVANLSVEGHTQTIKVKFDRHMESVMVNGVNRRADLDGYISID